MRIQKSSACPCGHVRYGYKIKDRKLIRSAKRSLHLLRQPQAWAIQKSILDKHRQEIAEVVINDSESGKTYRAGIDLFLKRALIIERKFGPQYALALELWREDTALAIQPELF